MQAIIVRDKITGITTERSITGLLADFEQNILAGKRCENTQKAYAKNLRQFAAWACYAGISNKPTRANIIDFAQWLRVEHEAIEYAPDTIAGFKYRVDSHGNHYTETLAASTQAQYMRSVKQLFKCAAANGFYDTDIAAGIECARVDGKTHKKEALKPDNVRTIENSITARNTARAQAAAAAAKDTAGRIKRADEQGKRLFAIYLLAVNAGLRTIEISRARVKDFVTFDGQATLLVWGKGHDEPDTRKPLAPEVAAAIREYLNSRTDKPTANSPLFAATGNRSGGKAIAPTTISTMLKQAMRAAGFDSAVITAHSLRHTAGNNVMEVTGDNLYLAQQYMRHANPATTEIYLHRNTETQNAEIAQRLYNLYHGIEASADNRAQLVEIIDGMNGDQIRQLLGLAKAIAGVK